MTSENSENPIGPEQPPADTHSEADVQPRDPHPEVTLAAAEPQAKPPKHCCEVTCNTKRDGIDWATLALEGFGLLVLIVYTIATIAIWRANKKAANAAESAAHAANISAQESIKQVETTKQAIDATVNQFQLDQRAWIGLTDPHISSYEGVRLKIAFIFTNSGKTAAKNVQTDVDWRPAGGPFVQPICKDIKLKHPRDAPYVPPQGRFTLRDPSFDPAQIENTSDFYWDKTPNGMGNPYFCVIGKVTYSDVYDKLHFTHFCLYASKQSLNDVGYCGWYNDLN